jgi:hypothetical protein
MLDVVATDQLLSIAGELYSLLPADFTAARKTQALAAKAEGDKELAVRITALRKPSAAAWVVNQLARLHAQEMGQLLELGDSLRQAQADLDADALRELGRQRRQATAAITRQGRSLAGDLGLKVTDAVARQVEETLHAAMIDERASTAVRSGLLTEAITPSGLGALDADSVVAGGSAHRQTPAAATTHDSTPTLSVVPDNTQELETAEAAAEEAARAASKAGDKLDKAATRVAKREARILQLQAELEEVRRQAAELEHRLDVAADDLEVTEDKRDKAERRAQSADDDARTARARVEALRP